MSLNLIGFETDIKKHVHKLGNWWWGVKSKTDGKYVAQGYSYTSGEARKAAQTALEAHAALDVMVGGGAMFTDAHLEARLEDVTRYAAEAGLKLACDDPESALQCLRVAERIIGEVVPELELRIVVA